MWNMRRPHNPLLISITKNTMSITHRMRTALFWVITQRVMLLLCRCFVTTYWSHISKVKNSRIPPLGFWSHLRRSKIQEHFFLDYWTLKMGPIGCPETLIRNCHNSLRNNPEERSSDIFRGRSLKSRNAQNDLQYELMHCLLKKAEVLSRN